MSTQHEEIDPVYEKAREFCENLKKAKELSGYQQPWPLVVGNKKYYTYNRDLFNSGTHIDCIELSPEQAKGLIKGNGIQKLGVDVEAGDLTDVGFSPAEADKMIEELNAYHAILSAEKGGANPRARYMVKPTALTTGDSGTSPMSTDLKLR